MRQILYQRLPTEQRFYIVYQGPRARLLHERRPLQMSVNILPTLLQFRTSQR